MIELEEFYKTFLREKREIKPTKLVIFDKDGTLIYIEKIFVRWFHKIIDNIKDFIINLDDFYQYIGYDKEKNYFKSSSVLAKGTSDEVRNACMCYFKSIHPKKTEEEILFYLKPRIPEIEIKKEYIEPCW